MKLSIIIPAYNAARLLPDCLASIRRDMPPNAELIVANDCSKDDTVAVATPLADKIAHTEKNGGDGAARRAGIALATGDVFLFVDSDIIFPPGGCVRVLRAFEDNPDVAAIVGRLSTKPQPGFFTDYKNLYMNYIFGRLPKEVTFLYGSVFAVRAKDARETDSPAYRIGADTAFGQELARRGKKVMMVPELEVVHLKRHTMKSFYRNDFMIPYGWAKLFRRYNGWKQVGRRGTGFAHSSKAQLASLAVSWMTLLLAAGASAGYFSYDDVLASAAIWLVLNVRFLAFLFGARGVFYGLLAIPVTFVDHLVMAAGAGLGLINAYGKGQHEL